LIDGPWLGWFDVMIAYWRGDCFKLSLAFRELGKADAAALFWRSKERIYHETSDKRCESLSDVDIVR
jgi:hypothetical protein